MKTMNRTYGSIRTFYDPITAILISTGISVVGSLVTGFAQAGESQQQAQFADQQADQEQEIRRQELRDFEKEQRREESRSNAIFAAIGADLTSGNPLAISQSRAAETAVGRLRINQQSFLREQGFRNRASGFRTRARTQRIGSLVGAASTAARGGNTFLRVTRTQAATGAR